MYNNSKKLVNNFKVYQSQADRSLELIQSLKSNIPDIENDSESDLKQKIDKYLRLHALHNEIANEAK